MGLHPGMMRIVAELAVDADERTQALLTTIGAGRNSATPNVSRNNACCTA